MAVSLKHTFQSAKADGADSSLVQPSNWNAVMAIQKQTEMFTPGSVEVVYDRTTLTLSDQPL